MLALSRRLLPLLALALAACDQAPRFTQAEPGEALSAGSATVFKRDHNAFSLPSANLSPLRRLDFSVGNSFFRNPWVIAPSTTIARDGLGPLFNTNACQNCHIKDGRGHPPGPGALSTASMLVRLSVPADTLFSARIAPPMIGLGLLEAIPESALLAHADPDDADEDGISGRPNRVWDDVREKTVLGRFGWKAGQPNLNQQNAHAFAGDMGLTSSLMASDDCTAWQTACRKAVNGGEPEVSQELLASVLFYTRNLAVPARRDVDSAQVLNGKGLFHQAGCQKCHVPSFTTAAEAAEPELAKQLIRPYSDLLLHDMGEGLADNREEFLASGREWRTPPLWGIGLTEAVNGHTQFLHDGRARNLLEAILWHGGEAEAAKQQVLTFTAEERSALLAFLNSL